MAKNDDFPSDLWNITAAAATLVHPVAGVAVKGIQFVYKHFSSSDFDGNIPKDRIRNYQEPVLSKQRLAEISKANKVPSASEVYARKERLQDSYSITLTYGINGEPFPPKQNNFVVIISKALKSDIDSLFGNDELIIIKK